MMKLKKLFSMSDEKKKRYVLDLRKNIKKYFWQQFIFTSVICSVLVIWLAIKNALFEYIYIGLPVVILASFLMSWLNYAIDKDFLKQVKDKY